MTPARVRRVLAAACAALPLYLAAGGSAQAVQITTMVTINDNNTCPGTWQTSGTPTAPVFTCVVNTPPPTSTPTAPVCTITPSQTVASNSSVALALRCTSPTDAPITYSWTQGSTGSVQVANTASYTTPNLTTSTTYFATASANNLSTTYQTTVSVQTPTTPPPTTLTSCAGYTVVNVGDLRFDGTQLVTSGMKGGAVMVGRIVVPDPLPAGYYGKQASLSAFSWVNATAWKKVVLSKTPCDFGGTAPRMSQGLTANLYLSFGAAGSNAVTVQAGETWYLNVKHELPFGGQSCGNGMLCDFGVRVYPPGN
jgi:hypothetical protein